MIRINAESKGEEELYLKKFGFRLFGDEAFFNERSRFDLEPLRLIAENALPCDDVDGTEYVRLKEVQAFWSGAHLDVEIRRSEDLFASLRDREKSFPEGGKIVKTSSQNGDAGVGGGMGCFIAALLGNR